MEKRKYRDDQGRLVHDLAQAFVESTKMEVSPKRVQQVDMDSYSRISELPFAQQLK
ncbi:MAG: hypothetical protein PVSMB1_05070 [Gemmatimonadaceae bacterium]